METLAEVYKTYKEALGVVKINFKKMSLNDLDIQFKAYEKHFGHKPRHTGDIESWRARQIINTSS